MPNSDGGQCMNRLSLEQMKVPIRACSIGAGAPVLGTERTIGDLCDVSFADFGLDYQVVRS